MGEGAGTRRTAGMKPIRFRIYPERGTLYAIVHIWPNKTAMYKYNPLGRTHAASCAGRERIIMPKTRKSTRIRKDGLFAELNFHRDALGTEVIAHEITHAAFCWAERRQLDLNQAVNQHKWATSDRATMLPQDGVEERFCYALGAMFRQFVARCYKLGFYKTTA